MTREQFLEFHKEMCEKMHSICQAKNADYAGAGEDAFHNFTTINAWKIPTEVGFMTRMTDKMARIASFIERGQLEVKDESVEDTLLDLANYCLLFVGYLESRKRK